MEFELISLLKPHSQADHRLQLGIGDDCAILPGPAGKDLLVTTDTLLDGVHFLTSEHSFAQIARKSLAVSVSDIAAMGGIPEVLFLNFALPRSWTPQQAQQFFSSFAEPAQEFGLVIAGGDTTSWNDKLAITTTVHGYVPTGTACLRSGAKIGDLICVSGHLGGSIFDRQFSFQPRVEQGVWLREHGCVTSMMDLSDGLASDIHHLLKASRVGAEIYLEQLPISADNQQQTDGREDWEHALTDGEDFELLWTMPAEKLDWIRSLADCPVNVHPIGKIVRGSILTWFMKAAQTDREPEAIEFRQTGYVHRLHEKPNDST